MDGVLPVDIPAAHRTHGGTHMATVDERRAKALELHLAGATYDAIAEAVGYSDRGNAYRAVQQALDDLGTYTTDDSVQTELARLDAMLTGLWAKARRGDVQAIDRVMKIDERRFALKALANRGVTQEAGTALDELAARRTTAGRPNATGVTGTEASGV